MERDMSDLESDDYAYPGTRFTRSGHISGEGQGMTLRDYFAGQALAGHMADAEASPHVYSDDEFLLARAKFLYRFADAMLATRNTPTPDGEAR